MEAIIHCINVGISYSKVGSWMRVEKKWVLRSVSMSIEHGQTLGIIGRNGAGKSSFLRVLARISDPDEGEVIIRANRVALLALGVGFLAHLSGEDNIIHSLMLFGLRLKEAKQQVGSVLDLANLAEFSDRPVGTYSAGMRARLGFAIAYHVDAELLLVDEVVSVGDQEFRAKCRKLMREKVSQGKASVIVSHDLNLLRSWCDKIAWFDNGSLRMIGRPEDVIPEYRKNLR